MQQLDPSPPIVSERTRPERRSSVLPYVVVAVVFLALGIGGVVALDALRGAASDAPAPATAAAPAAPPALEVARPAAPVQAPAGPAADPDTAVAQFLAAEQEGDHVASYALLTGDNRTAIGSVEQWVRAHADIPAVAGWEPGHVTRDGETATVSGTLRLQPSLDEVAGLVPGTALAVWELTTDGRTWFVDFDGSTLTPQYADEATAPDAAQAWLSARARCETAAQYDGGLVGTRTLADQLCDAGGTSSVGVPRALTTPELDLLLPPFGAEAEVWARAVDVTGAVPLTLLLAPLGDAWVVVGVTPSGA